MSIIKACIRYQFYVELNFLDFVQKRQEGLDEFVRNILNHNEISQR